MVMPSVHHHSHQRTLVRDLMMVSVGIGMTLIVLLMFDTAAAPIDLSIHTLQPTLVERLPDNGWSSIHVYHDNPDQLIASLPENKFWLPPKHQGKRWFSQHGQDVAVMKVLGFPKNGFFVDLAANDAIWASNTFIMEKVYNWDGLCIEANPYYWYRLSNRKCKTLGAVVGSKDGEQVSVALGMSKGTGPFSGIVGQEFDNKGTKSEPLTRYTVTLETILKGFNAPKVIDFLSLDVEGAETYILKAFPFDEYTIKCMTIERPSDELVSILNRHGYQKVLDFEAGDGLWVHKTLAAKAKAIVSNESHLKEIRSRDVSLTV